MAKTIIQTIGPLYGEVVNGTVFGRPNGSIFVPLANTLKISLTETYRYVLLQANNRYAISTSAGLVGRRELTAVAESQDVANYLQIQLATDSDFTDLLGSATYPAGQFNIATYIVAAGDTPIVAETTYYLRVILFAGSGEPVATSETIEVSGVEV